MNRNSWIFCTRASRNSNYRMRCSSSKVRSPRREPEKFSNASCGNRSGAEKPAACKAEDSNVSELDFVLGRVDLLAIDAGHLHQVLESLEVAVLLAILNDRLRLFGGQRQPGLDLLGRSLVDLDLVGSSLAEVLGQVVDDDVELFVLGHRSVLDHGVHQGAPFGLSLLQF